MNNKAKEINIHWHQFPVSRKQQMYN